MGAHVVGSLKIDRQETKIDWVLFITLVNAILLSGCVQYFNIFVLAALNIVLQFMLLKRINFKLSRKVRIAILVIFLYLLYSFVIVSKPSDIKFIMFRFHDIFSALLILNYIIIRRPNFERTLAAVLIFFMVHGFVNWIVVNAAFGLFSGTPSIIKSYRFLVFFGMEQKYFGIHRSQGLFWEPGVYQVYLNIALHFFLFYRKKLIWAALAFLGVVLTLSTTGVLLAGIQLAYYLLFNSKRGVIGKTIIIASFLPMILVYYGFASTVVMDKVSGDKAGSFVARSFDAQTGIGVALAHPYGIGFDPETYQTFARDNAFGFELNLNTDRGQTNGIIMLAYSTGLFWAAVMLFFMFMQRIFPSHRILFFIVLAASIASEPLFYSPFVLLFVISGMINYRLLDGAKGGILKQKSIANNGTILNYLKSEKV